MSANNPKYTKFGNLLLSRRQQVGISQQAILANMMNTTQQTISRWESGYSRPRYNQISLLANILKTNVDELSLAAGYIGKEIVATFDKPFPLEALDSDSFERFCLHFLAKLYPSAHVHRAGGAGHTQEGVDIDALFPDKSLITFQCKRVSQFGPQKVHTAVARHNRKAKEKYLLLSRIASPQARRAIQEHKTWDIWDKEDISRHIRQLSRDDQRRLVDIFFRGQRLALLGESESGPWQTTTEFFAPFMSERGIFNHAWTLVGKEDEIKSSLDGLSNEKVQVVFLVGPGGSGKSRVLKQVVETFETGNIDVIVRFLSSPTEEVTNKSFDDFRDCQKVLVVDDAHDRGDLDLLFRYASISENKTTLLIATRPYAIDYIRSRASTFALAGERISEVRLKELSIEEATELATQVLERFEGPVIIAKDIARLTRDCPLATVVGAQIISKERIPFELAKNEESFRSTLLGKFQDIIAGNLGNKRDSTPIKNLLRILSLLQPFHIEDTSIYEVASKIEDLDQPEISRLIRILIDGGVLFKRGGQFRLSPDVLADYIIEDTCIGPNGKSTGYAERVFEIAGDSFIKNLLLNLGKIDWRRSNGDPSNSQLLEGVWSRLRPVTEYGDQHVEAVASVAYYQPSRALDFAENLIRERQNLHGISDIIKNAAYNLGYLPRACECLWAMGKDDTRALNQNPDHAIRILSELCAVEQNKPLDYNRIVVEFGLSLIDQEGSWDHKYSPLDILKGILQTEGDTITSNGRTFSFHPYLVSPTAVSSFRNRVIDASLNLLTHPNIKVAVLAARFLEDCIRYPSGLFGMKVPPKTLAAWTEQFVQTLEKIERVIQNHKIDTLVFIELLRAVSWHASYAKNETSVVAKRLMTLVPVSIEFRTTLALVDGYGYISKKKNYEQSQQEWNSQIDSLGEEFISTYPDAEKLYSFIESLLSRIQQNYTHTTAFPYIFYSNLLNKSIDFARVTVEKALVDPQSTTNQFSAAALSLLLAEDHSYGLTIARRFIDTNSPDLCAAVAIVFGTPKAWKQEYLKEDLSLIQALLKSTDDWVVKNAVDALRVVAQNDPRTAVELSKLVEIGDSSKIADIVFCLFGPHGAIPFDLLLPDDVGYFLNKLRKLPMLDGYWIETFLSYCSQHHAPRTAKFFMYRVDYAVKTKNWDCRPCNYGPYRQVALQFRSSKELKKLLREVTQWMTARMDSGCDFHYHAAHLFGAMFLPFDGEVLDLLKDWIDVSTASDICLISQVLRETPNNFVFEKRLFVEYFLEKAALHGKDTLDRAVDALWGASISGLRSGTPGEPFPEDLRMKDLAEKVLSALPRFSPAYRLYEMLKQHTEHEIKRALLQRESFED